MPSLCRFAAATAAYRETVVPRGLPAVVVEAATSFGWHRFVGPDAAFVTMERFGASAPAPRLFEEFGFTPDHVARVAEQAIAARRA